MLAVILYCCLQQAHDTVRPIIEVERIEVGEIPDDIAKEIERLEGLAANEQDVDRKSVIEKRIENERERGERMTTTYIFGRFPNGTTEARNFYEYPVQLEMRTSLVHDIAAADLPEIALPDPQHGMWLGQDEMRYPDIQRVWRGVRVKEVERRDWWTEARDNYAPLYRQPDQKLTDESGLRIAGLAEAPYERVSNWYQYTFTVENSGARAIELAQFVIQLHDKSGDVIAGPTDDALTHTERGSVQLLAPGEQTQMIVDVPTYMHLRYGSASLVCTFVRYAPSQ